MDVSIRPAEKVARDAGIAASEKKQAARAMRKEKLDARREEKIQAVVNRRRRRRFDKKVRAHLIQEKRLFLANKATGNEYVINARFRYKNNWWSGEEDAAKDVLAEVLAKHSGFEYEAEYDSYRGDDKKFYCRRIIIKYTLLES